MTDYMETMHPRETSKETMEDVSLLALDMEQGLEAIARLCADDFNPVEITGTVLSGLLRMLLRLGAHHQAENGLCHRAADGGREAEQWSSLGTSPSRASKRRTTS